MDKSEKRFERDIESFLISEAGGYAQFNGQDAEGNWVKTRQHDIDKCIYMDVLCEFIAKTQPKEWAKYLMARVLMAAVEIPNILMAMQLITCGKKFCKKTA